MIISMILVETIMGEKKMGENKDDGKSFQKKKTLIKID